MHSSPFFHTTSSPSVTAGAGTLASLLRCSPTISRCITARASRFSASHRELHGCAALSVNNAKPIPCTASSSMDADLHLNSVFSSMAVWTLALLSTPSPSLSYC
ncbi:hypothetical protein PIB30_042563 [Stylosanthes scabra]|uniref:Uncharacterized protein n=1 Tax=Stylosanthes scabra TaxID=79078 RepID=A0ABU6YHM7_9FABA|nr:hypothetical protein [Stylosanthes scabra]